MTDMSYLIAILIGFLIIPVSRKLTRVNKKHLINITLIIAMIAINIVIFILFLFKLMEIMGT